MVDRARKIKFSEAEVIAVYQTEKSALAASKKLGIGHNTTLRILAKNGIRSIGQQVYRENAKVFKPEVEKAIAAEYERGAWLADLLRKYGGSYHTLRNAIRSNGVDLRLNPAPTVKPGEVEEILKLRKTGMTHTKISIQIGRTQPFVSKILRDHGDETKNARNVMHGAWQGGRMKTGGGYIRVLVPANDPMASMRDQKGYVLEHRLSMARVLGRPLTEKETVHHIDMNKENNRPENLQLRHGRHGRGAVMKCMHCGSVNIGFAQIQDTED